MTGVECDKKIPGRRGVEALQIRGEGAIELLASCALLFLDEVHELLAGLDLLEDTGEVARRGERVLLLHAAHLHAHVLGLDDDHHAERVEGLLYALLDLEREALRIWRRWEKMSTTRGILLSPVM